MRGKPFTYLAYVTLILFVFTNAGFTKVVETCSMDDMACCEDVSAGMRCGGEGPASGMVVINAGIGCMVLETLGGLSDTHAIQIKSVNETTKQDPACFPCSFVINFSDDTACNVRPLIQSGLNPPAPNARYLLNVALLI